MAYTPFKDYLGLTQVAWTNDNTSDFQIHFDHLMPPAAECRHRDSNFGQELFSNVLASGMAVVPDPMESFGSIVQEEFNRNGVDTTMDEVDDYQVRVRGRMAMGTGGVANRLSGEQRRQERRLKALKGCTFCKNNGRSPEEYLGHVLKDKAGNTSCPVLRNYTCPKCGVSGDKAHTIRYCPKL